MLYYGTLRTRLKAAVAESYQDGFRNFALLHAECVNR